MGDDYENVYMMYLNRLGNLTLTAYNSEIGDKSFKEKTAYYKDSKFTKLNIDIIDKDRWGKKEISARGERLASELLDIFRLPKEFENRPDFVGQREVRLTPYRERVTYKQPLYFTFWGETRRCERWKDMLIGVCEILYELDSQRMWRLARDDYKMPRSTNVFISFDKEKVKDPKEICQSGMYIYTNLSAETVVNYIEYILKEFRVPTDDFVFYMKD